MNNDNNIGNGFRNNGQFDGGFENMNEDYEKMAENMLMQAQLVYKHVKDIKEIHQEMKVTQSNIQKSEEKIIKVGEFMMDFYNEYRDHDALTTAQAKEMKEAQHDVTSIITRILAPRLQESRKRGTEYLVIWNGVNKAIWSIFKRNVNGVNIPFDRTPKVKFKQAMEYLKSLTVADYLAYKDTRWGDIKKFNFDETLVEEKRTIEQIIGMISNDNKDNEGNDNNGTPMMLI